MNLSEEHRRFLLVDNCAIPTAINLVVNGLIAWLMNRSVATVPIWGGSSVTLDLLATSFLLPFIVCAIVSSTVKGKVRSGKLSPIPPNLFPISHWYKRSLWLRAIFLGIAGVLFAGIPIVWSLSIGQAQPFPMMSFVVFKAFWAAAIASLITPIVGWWALANASGKLH
ncbi:MAG: hypothetical protein QNJ72_06865 [Pleurocapsa sp. MO_226.B13]|nr:hypothetical protein [Pleurocapsa sp. MO_226.B13]